MSDEPYRAPEDLAESDPNTFRINLFVVALCLYCGGEASDLIKPSWIGFFLSNGGMLLFFIWLVKVCFKPRKRRSPARQEVAVVIGLLAIVAAAGLIFTVVYAVESGTFRPIYWMEI